MIMTIAASLEHNWMPLSVAMLVAAIMKVYVNPEKLKTFLLKKAHVSIWASVAFGAFTPICACGTMAVIIGMLTTTLSWSPIMAFLTSSPLMSPDGFILLAGIIGLKFAIALTLTSIVIGLGSGYITHMIEKRTHFLKDQTRFTKKDQARSCACSKTTPVPKQVCCDVQLCCAAPADNKANRILSAGACCQVSVKTGGMNLSSDFIKKHQMT
jgi:uncharacterized membrane protein YraQ (UPF0718 family)